MYRTGPPISPDIRPDGTLPPSDPPHWHTLPAGEWGSPAPAVGGHSALGDLVWTALAIGVGVLAWEWWRTRDSAEESPLRAPWRRAEPAGAPDHPGEMRAG